jgi:hypothetical protein
MIEKLVRIEKAILARVSPTMAKKEPQYKVREQVANGCIKLQIPYIPHDTNNTSLVLKVSGIWETDQYYGLTYKFSRVEPI